MTLDSSAPTSRIYFSQRLRLHYVDWGNPRAPPLVLLHGGRDHCRNWDWVATALRRDWHVLAPDLRGHGDSQWSPDGNYTLAAFIYDLAQLIHQQELALITIIGHSLGGNIALRYTGIYPDNVRRVVAIEGVGASPEKTAERARVPLAERMQLSVIAACSGPSGNYLAFHWFFLGGIGDDDAALGLLLFLDATNQHAILQRSKFHESLQKAYPRSED